MSPTADLPDVNVWLAISLPDHPHHLAAQRYWAETSADVLAFCRVTALGYLRLLCNKVTMAGRPLEVPDAWHAYRSFRRLPEVVLAPEPEGCEELLGKRAIAGEFTPRLWTDAYLAAFATAGGFRLVSFDGDFDGFKNLDRLRLKV
jgi:toxin-antitoxin system PIN domain toxin